MEIENVLLEVQKVVAGVEKINNGGCGVFAALVAKRLHRMGYVARVRIGQMDSFWSSRNENCLINAKDNGAKSMYDFYHHGVSFDHLIVEILLENGEVLHFDSDQLHPAKEKTVNYDAPILNGHLTPLEALRIAKEKQWNPLFNRKQIPAMIKALNGVFRKQKLA